MRDGKAGSSGWIFALLAILLQVLQPGLMLRAAAAERDGLGFSQVICSEHQTGAPGQHREDGKACRACALCGAVHVLAADAVVLPMPRALPLLARVVAAFPPIRGPPCVWARARGPPFLS